MSTTITARDRFLFDLFTTALEGGINYWAEVLSYHWEAPEGDDDLRGFSAEIIETEEDGEPRHRIDRKVIARGYKLATTKWRDRIHWSTAKPPVVVKDPAEWDFDASDADVILQLGLFGETVYG